MQRMWTLIGTLFLAGAVTLAQSGSMELSSLEQRLTDAQSAVSRASGLGASERSDLERELQDLEDDLTYLRVKQRKGERVTDRETSDLGERIDRFIQRTNDRSLRREHAVARAGDPAEHRTGRPAADAAQLRDGAGGATRRGDNDGQSLSRRRSDCPGRLVAGGPRGSGRLGVAHRSQGQHRAPVHAPHAQRSLARRARLGDQGARERGAEGRGGADRRRRRCRRDHRRHSRRCEGRRDRHPDRCAAACSWPPRARTWTCRLARSSASASIPRYRSRRRGARLAARCEVKTSCAPPTPGRGSRPPRSAGLPS